MTLVEPASTAIAVPEAPGGSSDHAACLSVLLDWLDWRGTPQELAAAMAAPPATMSDRELRATLANLGFAASRVRDRLGNVPAERLPCLFVPDKGALCVVLAPSGGGRLCFDARGRDGFVTHDLRQRGTITTFARAPEAVAPRAPEAVAPRERTLVGLADRLTTVLATAAIALLGLAVPLVALTMLDVAARDTGLLASLAGGAMLALVAEFLLRGLRGAVLARRAGRRAAHAKPLPGDPPTPPTDAEAAALDLAAAPAALIALLSVAGPVAAVPVAALGLVLLAGTLLGRRSQRAAARTRPARQELTVSIGALLATLRASRAQRVEPLWQEHLHATSAALSALGRGAARRLGVAQALADSLALAAGGAVVLLLATTPDAATPGTLVAALLLTWRALAPAGAWLRGRAELAPSEPAVATPRAAATAPTPRLTGRLAFSGVAWTPPEAASPALAGVSFLVRPGESVALSGRDGAGKSSLLRLAAGVVAPDDGAIRLDSVDLARLDPAARAQSILYIVLPLKLETGTIADAVRAAHPLADDAAVRDALDAAGVLEIVDALPDGLATQVGPQPQDWLSTGTRAALGLARAYISPAQLVLIDDIDGALDAAGEAAFRVRLNALRGRRTVVFATHRPGLIGAADRVLILRRGRLAHDGTPGDLVRRLPRPG